MKILHLVIFALVLTTLCLSGCAPTSQRSIFEETEINPSAFSEEDYAILEEAIKDEVTEALEAEKLEVSPPVGLEIKAYLYMLAVSPRQEISLVGWEYFDTPLSDKEIVSTEWMAAHRSIWFHGIATWELVGPDSDPLYSAAVVRLTGLSTDPPKVALLPNLPEMVTTTAHEWAHRYLEAYPLSHRDPDDDAMRMIEEAVANTVEEEIYSRIAIKYGWGPYSQLEKNANLRGYFRSIRANVDNLLAAGRIEQAESYMEEARLNICAVGDFCPRKINQGYFATMEDAGRGFEGANSISQMMQNLRARYPTLKEFLDDIKMVGSYEEFLDLCEEHGINPDE